jgi:hypothetical protein
MEIVLGRLRKRAGDVIVYYATEAARLQQDVHIGDSTDAKQD